MIACVIFVLAATACSGALLASRGGEAGVGRELHLIEVSEVVRQPERPHKQRLDRVRLLSKIVDGVLEAVAVLPYFRLAPPCLLYTSPSPRDATLSRMPSSA